MSEISRFVSGEVRLELWFAEDRGLWCLETPRRSCYYIGGWEMSVCYGRTQTFYYLYIAYEATSDKFSNALVVV